MAGQVASRLLACAPLLLLALLAWAAAGIGAATDAASAVSALLPALPAAAGATLICLLVGLPAALLAPGSLWLIPFWLALCAAPAGWAAMATPGGGEMARVFVLASGLLPVMVLCLKLGLACIPRGLGEGAACAGASRGAVLVWLVLPLAWWPLLWASFVVLCLATGAAAALPR